MKRLRSVEAQGLVKYGSFITVAGLNIHMWHMGSGYPVVLIHGFTGTSYDWRFTLPAVANKYSVYALDLPGFGYSQKPLDFQYNADGYADFVVTFLDVLNIDKAILAGNSLGGHVALKTGAKYPHRIPGLVLIDSGGYPRSMNFLLFKLLAVPVLGGILMQLIDRSVIRRVLTKDILCDGSFATDDVISDYNNVYQTANARKIPPVVVRNMPADELETPEMLKQIKCPVLIIWGEQDKVIPLNWAKSFNRDIPDSSIITISEAGHMPQVEKAEIVNDAIVNFVRELQ